MSHMSGKIVPVPCETPLMEKNPKKPPAEHPQIPSDLNLQISPAESQKVAFKLGGSEETDLNSDLEGKDLEISNGENVLSGAGNVESFTSESLI